MPRAAAFRSSASANIGDYVESSDQLVAVCARTYDPFYMVRSVQNPKGLPYIYQACGSKDGLVGVNRLLDRSLASAHVDHVYRESPGAHNWRYWDQALKGMFEVMDKVSPGNAGSTVSPLSPQPPASASAPSHRQSSP